MAIAVLPAMQGSLSVGRRPTFVHEYSVSICIKAFLIDKKSTLEMLMSIIDKTDKM